MEKMTLGHKWEKKKRTLGRELKKEMTIGYKWEKRL